MSEEATRSTYEMLRKDWEENSDKIPKLFWLKFRNELQQFMIDVARKYGQACSQWYYIFYMACACIGVGYALKERRI